jgi:hypothetical protein
MPRSVVIGAGNRFAFAAPDAGDDAGEAVALDQRLQARDLARDRARGGRQGRIHRLDRRARRHDQLEPPPLGVARPEVVDLGELEPGVDMGDL